MNDLASRIRRLVEDHILTPGVDFEFRQRMGPVFEANFNGPLPEVDFTGIGLRLFTLPKFYHDECGVSAVRFSETYGRSPVMLYLRSTGISNAED